MKISVCCVTYNRPHLIGELIHSFEMQTFPASDCELIILDDAGQYGDVRGTNWQVVSFPRRLASLGEKRNVCVSMSSPKSTHIVVADDDDIYLPWWLECHAKNFERGAEWSFASSVFVSFDNTIREKWSYRDDNNLLHPAHGFTKKRFWQVGGYPHLAGWEDLYLFKNFLSNGMVHEDALEEKQTPYLIYRRFSRERHMTHVSVEDYQSKYPETLQQTKFEIGWKRDYVKEVNEHENRH